MDEPRKPAGCGIGGFYGGMLRRRRFWHRRSASASSIPRHASDSAGKSLASGGPPPRRTVSDDTALALPDVAVPGGKAALDSRPPVPSSPRKAGRRPAESKKALQVAAPSYRVAADLDSMLYDRQKAKNSTALVRATSGNVMVYGHLGNLRANQNSSGSPNRNVLDYLPKTKKEMKASANGKNGHRFPGSNGVMGNIVRSNSRELVPALQPMRQLDPEELKQMGNEEYKKGRFAEALALYDRAIAMAPEKASYRSNKAAALTALGRLLEAVGECREAVAIEPSYHRAHHRLATLHLRLGEPEKAIHHYKLSRSEASNDDISRAQAVQSRLARCDEARKLKDWITVVKESQAAVSDGADSAPQVLALQAEALVKLLRHEEADSAFNGAPKFDIDASTRYFGATGNAYVLMVQALVDMVAGRFEDAVAVAQRAAQLDPSSREISVAVRRTRNVASARSRGNELFKASKFTEACIAYGEGLNHDPHNAVLLCNRAACRSKLGHYEKAVEDCNIALHSCPSYRKARLRRANCNSKLEKWEASIKDYELLVQEMPGDEEVSKALFEAKAQLKKRQGEEMKDGIQS